MCATAGTFPSHIDIPIVHPCGAGMGGNHCLHPRDWGWYVISTQLMNEGESSARAAAHKR